MDRAQQIAAQLVHVQRQLLQIRDEFLRQLTQPPEPEWTKFLKTLDPSTQARLEGNTPDQLHDRELHLAYGPAVRAGRLILYALDKTEIPQLQDISIEAAILSQPCTDDVVYLFWEKSVVPLVVKKFRKQIKKARPGAGSLLLLYAKVCDVIATVLKDDEPAPELAPQRGERWSKLMQIKEIASILGCKARSRTVKPKLKSIDSVLRLTGNRTHNQVRLNTMKGPYRKLFETNQ